MSTLLSWCPGQKCDPCKPPSSLCIPVPLQNTSPAQDPNGIPVIYSVSLNAFNLGGFWHKRCSPMLVWQLAEFDGNKGIFGIPVTWQKWLTPPDWRGNPGVPYPSITDITVTVTALGGTTLN